MFERFLPKNSFPLFFIQIFSLKCLSISHFAPQSTCVFPNNRRLPAPDPRPPSPLEFPSPKLPSFSRDPKSRGVSTRELPGFPCSSIRRWAPWWAAPQVGGTLLNGIGSAFGSLWCGRSSLPQRPIILNILCLGPETTSVASGPAVSERPTRFR